MSTLRQRLFAWMLKKGDSVNAQLYGHIKNELFSGVHGTVVEIGPGTGINLNYLKDDIEWIGLEPNTEFHDTIFSTAKRKNIKMKLLSSVAENIHLPDESADVVISTLVLCSVPDQQRVLGEIKRVLKKDGRLIFIEHVADEPGTLRRKTQNILNPLNRLFADGCNCNRDTGREIEKAGFSSVILHHTVMKGAMSLHAPHITGYAIK